MQTDSSQTELLSHKEFSMAGWIMGILMTVVALLGLFMASGARDDTFAWVGILFFITGVAFVYRQIIKNT